MTGRADREKDKQTLREVADEMAQTRVCPACGLAAAVTTSVCPNDGTALYEEPAPGKTIAGRYEFVSLVGQGGMSVIYKVRHQLMGKEFAIKMLHSHLVSESLVRRFQQEAKATSALSHPNIIAVHDFGLSEQGQPYLVMDFIDGVTLDGVLAREERLSMSRFLEIFNAVAGALAHAHAEGILHRDLKPSNIMLARGTDGHDEVKIVDFGIAKVVSEELGGQKLTKTGEVFGSPLYMSPEQIMGTQCDARCDLYSLGCVMFESLTGEPPHSGETSVATMFRRLNPKDSEVSSTLSGSRVPKAVAEIVTTLLEADPDQRYQSMEDLHADLSALQGSIRTCLLYTSPSPRD